MTVTPTDFRKNLFKLLDRIMETGETLEIQRKGKIFRLVPPRKRSKLDRLTPHPDAIIGESDDLPDIEWSETWKPSI
jgi:antitoxin (DNA-binding transcriptional repressor) of toxin-antitoxin stability system